MVITRIRWCTNTFSEHCIYVLYIYIIHSSIFNLYMSRLIAINYQFEQRIFRILTCCTNICIWCVYFQVMIARSRKVPICFSEHLPASFTFVHNFPVTFATKNCIFMIPYQNFRCLKGYGTSKEYDHPLFL